MAKFSDKQVLELLHFELNLRLESAEKCSQNLDDSNYRMFLVGRISLLRDLLSCLEFYSHYKFD